MDARRTSQHVGMAIGVLVRSDIGRCAGLVIRRARFRKFDRDHSGSLDKEEFRLALRRVARVSRKQLSDREIEQLFLAIDQSHNGSIDDREFVFRCLVLMG